MMPLYEPLGLMPQFRQLTGTPMKFVGYAFDPKSGRCIRACGHKHGRRKGVAGGFWAYRCAMRLCRRMCAKAVAKAGA